MNLRLVRATAAVDVGNVALLWKVSPRHGMAAAGGLAPAALAVLLVHAVPTARPFARLLCVLGIVPNTVGAIRARGGSSRSRLLSAYVAVGGAVLGVGYLKGLSVRG